MSINENTHLGRRKWIAPLSMLIVGLLALLLYGRALNFAFFNDDPSGHFAWMETRSFLDFFISSAEYGYYRPVVFVTLKGLVMLGGYNAALHHGLLLLLNSANVAMLWLLALRLSKSRAYAWAAALIFLAFPFSYEAVAYVASLTHPLLLFWLLLTILLYQQAAGGNRIFYIAAFIAMLLGLFTHENGLFIPLALVGVEWLERPPRGLVEGIKRPFMPFAGAAILFFLLWLAIPKNSDQGLASFNTLANNLMPFLQSVVYPALPVVRLSSSDITALVLLSIAILGLLLGAAVAAGAKRLWLFGLGWFGLSILPALLFLSSDYVYGSPRLHYLAAAGIALLLALPVLALSRRAPQRGWTRAAAWVSALAYTLIIVLPPLPFVHCELDFYEEASVIVRQMADMAAAAPEEQALLFGNIPFFFSSSADHPQGCENPYPWTPVGAVVIPPYAASRDFVRFNKGPDRSSAAVTIPDYGPGWNSFGPEMALEEVRQQLDETAVFIYDLNRGGFFDLSRHWQTQGTAEEEAVAEFGDQMALLEGTAGITEGNDALVVTLHWQVLNPPQSSLTAFVHLYDQTGALVAQHDGPPGDGFVPVHLWATADHITDDHILALINPLPPGQYTLAAGLYDPLNGVRLPVLSNGTALADDIYIIEEIVVQSNQ